MGPSPIFSAIRTITIGAMLSVITDTKKKLLRVNRP